MYAEHVPIISEYVKAEPDGFKWACTFAICSMRQKFTAIPGQLGDVVALGGQSDALFGFKRGAFYHVERHAASLLARVKAAPGNLERLLIICETPGIGLVKAAFVLQLMGYDMACLDSRNIKREGRNPRAYDTNGRKETKAFAAKAARYVAEVEGRAEEYWDAWCIDVAGTYGLTPHEVSAMHLAIVPDDRVPF